jgi:hypothetical protein
MPLKWVAVVVAAVSVTLCVSVNVLVGSLSSKEVPVVVNMATIAVAVVGAMVAVVADLYERINSRITALTEFLVTRLDEIDVAADRREAFTEGYLLGHDRDAAVVPIGPRSRGPRVVTGNED